MARQTFKTDVEWTGVGVQCVAKINNHKIIIDEPADLGGSDQGPNPVELILASLGGSSPAFKSGSAIVTIAISIGYIVVRLGNPFRLLSTFYVRLIGSISFSRSKTRFCQSLGFVY